MTALNQPERLKRQSPREAAALHTYFNDVDKAAVGAIEKRFGKFVSAERLKALPDLATKFETPHEFRDSYRAETGHKAPQGLAGFTKPELPAHVSLKNLSQVPEAVLHERLHQLASPEANRVFGEQLYEGVTQDLAIEILGKEPQPGDITGYPAERHRAHNLRKLLGSEAVCHAYFQGDTKPLKAAIDHVLAERPLAAVQNRIKELPERE